MLQKYSKEQADELFSLYLDFDPDDHDGREKFIASYCKKHEKTKRSVISKLSKTLDRDGNKIYIARPKVSKVTNAFPETKREMLQKIANKLGADISKLEGIDISPKLSLLNLYKLICEMKSKAGL